MVVGVYGLCRDAAHRVMKCRHKMQPTGHTPVSTTVSPLSGKSEPLVVRWSLKCLGEHACEGCTRVWGADWLTASFGWHPKELIGWQLANSQWEISPPTWIESAGYTSPLLSRQRTVYRSRNIYEVLNKLTEGIFSGTVPCFVSNGGVYHFCGCYPPNLCSHFSYLWYWQLSLGFGDINVSKLSVKDHTKSDFFSCAFPLRPIFFC